MEMEIVKGRVDVLAVLECFLSQENVMFVVCLRKHNGLEGCWSDVRTRLGGCSGDNFAGSHAG